MLEKYTYNNSDLCKITSLEINVRKLVDSFRTDNICHQKLFWTKNLRAITIVLWKFL